MCEGSNNILKPWITPISDDYDQDNVCDDLRDLETSIVSIFSKKVQKNDKTTINLFKLLSFDTLIQGNIGPQFCKLSSELQLQFLIWYQKNITNLKTADGAGIDLLLSICIFFQTFFNQNASSVPIHNSIYSLAKRILLDINPSAKSLIDCSFAPFSDLEIFSVALRNDLSQKLQSPIPALTSLSYEQTALLELKETQLESNLSSNFGKQRFDFIQPELQAIISDLDDNFAYDNMNDMDVKNYCLPPSASQPESTIFDESQIPFSQDIASFNIDSHTDNMILDSDRMDISTDLNTHSKLSDSEKSEILSLSERFHSLDDNDISSQYDIPLSSLSILVESLHTREVLELFQFDDLSDEILSTILSHLITDDLSYSKCLTILEITILNRIRTLDKTASRTLLNLLNSLIAVQQNAVLSAILVPLFIGSDDGLTFGSAQAELVSRVIKNLNQEAQLKFIVELLSTSESTIQANRWTTSNIDLLTKLLPSKPQWTPKIAEMFVNQLKIHATDMTDQPKAAEKMVSLVWTMLLKCDSKLLFNHKESLSQVVKMFKTPLSEKTLAKIESI